MRHSFLDKYSNLDSPVHRMNPKIKIFLVLGYILLVIFIPLRGLVFIVPFLALLILLSRVPLLHFFTRSLVIVPFALLCRWDLLLKGFIAVLTIILLSSTTKFTEILKALQGFGLPKLIVMIMSFMYRYIFVLIDELMRMKHAYDSRIIRRNRKFEIRTLANLLGLLFIRSYERAERIYMAMCSRGFNGVIK